MKQAKRLVRFRIATFIGNVVQDVIKRNGMLPTMTGVAQVRDRHVQRDAVHPCREAALRVVTGEGAPELCRDFLREVGAVFGMRAVGKGHLQHDATVPFEQFTELLSRVVLHGGCYLHGSLSFRWREAWFVMMIRGSRSFLTRPLHSALTCLRAG